jgi:undecaprenyl-diphosphatase
MDPILLLKAALLGLVEGATEFIPVSSTGHLILTQGWLGLEGRKVNAFSIFIQLGAILAVVWLYRRKLLDVLAGCRRDPVARRFILNLVVATIPAVVVGLPTDDWIEAHFFRPLPVAMALVAGGLAILAVERWAPRPNVASVDGIPVRRALGVGAIQVLSILLPGLSRSGATIMGGMALGLSRTTATEFSFFLAIPAMAGASIVKLAGVRDALAPTDAPFFAVGFVTAFVAALLVVKALVAFVSRRSFAPFAWYRIAFGAVLLAVYWDSRGAF